MAQLLWLLPTAVLLVADRAAKLWARTALVYGEPRPFIGQSIRLTRVHNIGGAFGLFPGTGTLFLAVSAAISAGILILLLVVRVRGTLLRIGLSVVLAGALGNLIDRFAYGYVLDFFEIRGFPVFNLADACITVGAALIIIHVLFGGERHRSSGQTDNT